jgi:hypothetical protein
MLHSHPKNKDGLPYPKVGEWRQQHDQLALPKRARQSIQLKLDRKEI